MRLKSQLYEKEQNEICDKIIEILQLDDYNSITLYELDNDKVLQNNIMELLPIIRKYFTYGLMKGVAYPDKCKRPYLTIIRNIIKLKYKMVSSDCTIEVNNSKQRTKRYYFHSKSS